MVAEVCLGKVGAVAAREVSRFARNSRDWQQLIEMCRVVDTVLIDQETGVRPGARASDLRLLLGLKGSLNEYELDLLRQRSALGPRREGPARRACRCRPRGLRYGPATGSRRIPTAASRKPLPSSSTRWPNSAVRGRRCPGSSSMVLDLPAKRDNGDVVWAQAELCYHSPDDREPQFYRRSLTPMVKAVPRPGYDGTAMRSKEPA